MVGLVTQPDRHAGHQRGSTRQTGAGMKSIALEKGVPVVLELTSADVIMGFSVPDFQARADIIPGRVARLRLVPDKEGTFTFLCDIFCGSGHETMNGTITVVA